MQGDDFVRTEPCTRLQGHVFADYTRNEQANPAEFRRSSRRHCAGAYGITVGEPTPVSR